MVKRMNLVTLQVCSLVLGRGMHSTSAEQVFCPRAWGACRSLGSLSVRSLHCLCQVRVARNHQGSRGSLSLAPHAGLSPLLPDPRLVLTGADPISLCGHRPLASRNHWPGRAAEPPGHELYHRPPPPHPATRAPVGNPKSISRDGFLPHLAFPTIYSSIS